MAGKSSIGPNTEGRYIAQLLAYGTDCHAGKNYKQLSGRLTLYFRAETCGRLASTPAAERGHPLPWMFRISKPTVCGLTEH